MVHTAWERSRYEQDQVETDAFREGLKKRILSPEERHNATLDKKLAEVAVHVDEIISRTYKK